jgi:hypothetical protein
VKRIRQLHFYLGTFLAPSIIFFAFSGALQIFRLQEEHPGSSYQPPAWIVALAGIHKDQRVESPPEPRPPSPAGETPAPPRPAAAPGGQPPVRKASATLKWFFLLTAIGIISTTILGIYMTFKYNRDRRVIWGLLVAGILLPIALLFL